MSHVASFLLCALVAWSVTRIYLRWALHTGVLDVPGARSSHPRPTPTGGGVGIVAGVAKVAADVDVRPHDLNRQDGSVQPTV